MFQVIEHFQDPVAATRKAYDMLNPGGYLCIETPATDSLAFSLFRQFWFPLLPPYHRHLFSRFSLRMLLSRYLAGGRVIKESSLYIPGEFSCSAALPFARVGPHPFRRRKQPILISLVSLLCICVAIMLALPGEILVGATERWSSLASHQRVLYRKDSN
jgi:predicted SAM-dependent methyltransferase